MVLRSVGQSREMTSGFMVAMAGANVAVFLQKIVIGISGWLFLTVLMILSKYGRDTSWKSCHDNVWVQESKS